MKQPQAPSNHRRKKRRKKIKKGEKNNKEKREIDCRAPIIYCRYCPPLPKASSSKQKEDNKKINIKIITPEKTTEKNIDNFISIIKNQYESISCSKLYTLYIEFFKEENLTLNKNIPIQVFGKKISKYFNKKIINNKVHYIINK